MSLNCLNFKSLSLSLTPRYLQFLTKLDQIAKARKKTLWCAQDEAVEIFGLVLVSEHQSTIIELNLLNQDSFLLCANCKSIMKSPVYPRYDGGDYAFDPQVDFSQFLEEAKRNAREERYDEANPQQQHQNMKSQSDEAKRSKKKSWKRSLLSWWKDDKKSSNSGKEQPPPQHRRGGGGGRLSSSGPLYAAGGGGGVISCKPRGPASGPLANLFLRQGKSAADEMPYMCLEKVDDPPSVPSYGPVYLVT